MNMSCKNQIGLPKFFSSQDQVSGKNLTSKLIIPLQNTLTKFTLCPYTCVRRQTSKGHELILE